MDYSTPKIAHDLAREGISHDDIVDTVNTLEALNGSKTRYRSVKVLSITINTKNGKGNTHTDRHDILGTR